MIKALFETFIMIIIPTMFAILIGIPLGSILYFKENDLKYHIVNIFVNSIRSFPYLIFVILLIPLTK